MAGLSSEAFSSSKCCLPVASLIGEDVGERDEAGGSVLGEGGGDGGAAAAAAEQAEADGGVGLVAEGG